MKIIIKGKEKWTEQRNSYINTFIRVTGDFSMSNRRTGRSTAKAISLIGEAMANINTQVKLEDPTEEIYSGGMRNIAIKDIIVELIKKMELAGFYIYERPQGYYLMYSLQDQEAITKKKLDTEVDDLLK